MNVTVGPVGEGAAVLLRALEPLEGIALMLARRAMGSTPRDLRNVARGPGCVARAMGITAAHNGVDLLGSSLFIAAGPVAVTASQVIATPRIGISKATDVLWRFVIAGHPCASGRRGANR
jgi:DNA-3-methyladenine glycosylase